MIKNMDINKNFGTTLLETPQPFCHYNPEAEETERHERTKLPKTLVCHDMANGYHDDSVIDGTGKHDAYTFFNWSAVDVFCYFSHHLITIPPLGWINVGHAHGVKVIGTIITEWSAGVVFWDRVLGSEMEWQNLASALVAIAKTLKFDGWLINIENKISKPEALLRFVEHLHTLLHQELREPELIWYDSVTVEGHLHWQNGLNEKNKGFFDVVDGFFTNYSWTVEDVWRSAEEAGDRIVDLYVGIDVWGRNFHGGGQFNTRQAVKVAHGYGCSLAIFAPAWTHEALCDHKIDSPKPGKLDEYDQFLLRDRALWGSLWPFLNTKLPTALPFQTSFCRGQGKKRRLYGEVICPVPWFNLRHMQYQPNSIHGPHGYVLSTVDNITNISRSGVFSSVDGVSNYRRSIDASKLDITPGQEISVSTKSVSIVENEEVDEDNERKPAKRKMRDVIKNLFKPKAQRTQAEAEEGPSSSIENRRSDNQSSSMIQLSVNIRLKGKTGKVRYSLAHVPSELECLEPFFEDSFTGGSCLKVNPRDEVFYEHRHSRIFHCDFPCDKMIVCVAIKPLVGYEGQFLNIILNLKDEKSTFKVVLVGHDVPQREVEYSSKLMSVYPTSDPDSTKFRELQKYVLLNEPAFYVPVQNSYGWKVRYYEFDAGGARMTSVNCRTGLEEGPILLGYFGVCRRVADDL